MTVTYAVGEMALLKPREMAETFVEVEQFCKRRGGSKRAKKRMRALLVELIEALDAEEE